MEFVGRVARKFSSPDELEIEVAKTERGAEIGRETGLFYVPRVLRFDAQAGVLESERIVGLRPLHSLIADNDPRLEGLLTRIGQALASIHERLVLPSRMKLDLPGGWKRYEDEGVFLHGDFSRDNVCFHEETGRLVIVDWSATRALGEPRTFGTPFFDIIWFGYSIYYHGLSSYTRLSGLMKGFEVFAEGYVSVRGTPLSMEKYRYHRNLVLHIQRHSARSQSRRRGSYPRWSAFLALGLLRHILCRMYEPSVLGDKAAFRPSRG